jgi:iron complex outermembrane receptor protein
MHTPRSAQLSKPHRLVLWSSLLSLLSLCSTDSAAGQTPAPEAAVPAPAEAQQTVSLPEFSVSADKVDPYRPTDTMSASRIRTDLMDTGLSVAVVSRELMEDLGANSGYDVTRYFAGISNGRAAGAGGIMDRQNFRGFENFTKTIDNFSSLLIPGTSGPQANFEPYFIERMEVVMGPDSILSPTGAAGGSINILTKSPKFERSNELLTEIGNYNSGKIAIDSTGAITKKLAYRVIAVYQDAQTYVPGQVVQQNLSVQLKYQFSPRTQVTFKYIGMDWGERGAITNANDNGWMVYTPDTVGGATISKTPPPGFYYDGWNGSATWSHRNDRTNEATVEFTTALFDKVQMRLGAAFLNDNFLQDAAYPRANPAESFDQNTGQVTSVAPGFTPDSMPIVGIYAHALNYDYQLQNDYAANFHPNGVTLQPVVGWAYQQGSNPTNLVYQNTTSYPNADLTTNNPYLVPHLPYSTYTLSTDQPAHGRQGQVYVLTRAGFFTDRLFISGGASRVWIDSNNYTFKIPDPTVAPPSLISLISRKDTYLGGLLVKANPHLSVYYTFSTNAVLVNNSGQPLWQSGKEHEFGFKTTFFKDRLSFSADHFQIAQTNLVTPNPAHNTDATQPSTLLGAATSHGIEGTLVGGLTKDLSIVASYTDMKYRDQFSRRVRNVPDVLANLLLSYRFEEGALKNASVFGGVVHFGQAAGETASTTPLSDGVIKQVGFYIPAWTALNVGGTYTWNRLHFTLNVDNALDQKFVWQAASRQSVSPYPGITVRLTTSYKF